MRLAGLFGVAFALGVFGIAGVPMLLAAAGLAAVARRVWE